MSQVFRKLRHGDQEGWVLKERVGPGNAAASTVKLLGDARLLANLPEALDDYGTDPALAELGKGAEATDLGVDASVDEKWVRGCSATRPRPRYGVGTRKRGRPPVITDHYVLTAGVNHLRGRARQPETDREA
nr:hypothetical protein [Deltaproteobacteria bacterium]